MLTRVKMSAEEEINRSVYASVVRSRSEKVNKRKNAARRSIEEAVNKILGEYYFCIQQMLIIFALLCYGVSCMLKWQRNAWLRYNLFILF